MLTQRWNFRMVLGALCVCFLGLSSRTSAQTILCSKINTSSMSKNTTQFQSHGACSLFCQGLQHPDINSDSYAFAILQNDGCWCSNYFPTGGIGGNLTQGCSTPCPGWPFEYCGAGDGHFTYEELSVAPSGTAGAGGPGGSAASSTTTASTTNKQVSSSSETATPIISIFTTVGQVHTITITPTSPANSQNGLTQKNRGGLGTGGAVGLTIGLVALIAIVSALIWFYFRRKRKQEAEELGSASRRGSSAGLGGLGGPIPSRTMSENSRYVLGTDGRQVVETWEPGDAPGRRRSRLMPVDPRLDPFAPVYQRNGENKSRESVNTLRDDHDYSRRVVHQGPILRATNPDHADD